MRQRLASIAFLSLMAPALATGLDEPAHLPMDIPALVEMAEAAGVSHSYDGPWEHFVGGGVAAFDCNGDRMPDLVMAGGTSPAKLFVNRSTPGKLSFEKSAKGLPQEMEKGTTGFYPLDVDQDGHMDLIALRVGANHILKGGPDCRFEEANLQFGLDGGRAWTTAFAATFEPDSPYPVLAFGNYIDRSAPGSPWGTCHDNVMIRPRITPDGPVYDEPMTLSPGYCTLSMLFTEWDRSGEPALRMTNDRQYYREGEEQLWRVTPGRPPRAFRTSDGWRRVQIWGMGIAEADLDGDGLPEYALTSMGDTKLQTRDLDDGPDIPAYRDIAFEAGVTAHRPYVGEDIRPSTGWHAEFSDMNNDGRLDLFIAKGNVSAMPDFAAFDPDNLLLARHDGTFAEAGERAGIALDRKGRGGATVDLDGDGMLDLVVVNRQAPASIFHNKGARAGSGTRAMGNWLKIELQQPGSNRNAVGALVTVKSGNATRTRTVRVGGGHASGQAGFVHVGTGVAERAEIRIKWPDESWSAPFRVFANNHVVIRRGEDAARYWYPPQTQE